MNDLRDVIRELLGHYAYDTGSVDSGVHDAIRRHELAGLVDAAPEIELRFALSRVIRDDYLSEEALALQYGWEDAMHIAQWFDTGDYRPRR